MDNLRFNLINIYTSTYFKKPSVLTPLRNFSFKLTLSRLLFLYSSYFTNLSFYS